MRAARRTFPAGARRHAASVAHQRIFPRRRQGADERVLPGGRCARCARCCTTPKSSLSRSSGGRFAAAIVKRGDGDRSAFGARAGGRRRRLRVESRVAARGVGAGRRQLHRARHAVQPGRGAASCYSTRASKSVGDPTQCHAVAIDARAPKFDGGIVTRVDCVSLGIVVNRAGAALLRRGRGFLAEALRDLGAAGRADSPSRSRIRSSMRRRSAGSCRRCSRRMRGSVDRELADEARARRGGARATVDRFNAAVRPGTFDHTVLDDCAPQGITPPKTHWARRSTRRRSCGYPLRPGITFTYLGVGDRRASAHA